MRLPPNIRIVRVAPLTDNSRPIDPEPLSFRTNRYIKISNRCTEVYTITILRDATALERPKERADRQILCKRARRGEEGYRSRR